MEKSIFMMALMAIAVTGTTLTSCKSAAQKNADAENKVIDAQQDLEQAESEVVEQRQVNAEEWEAFKTEAELQIDKNEVQIAELKAAMNAPGTTPDYEYEKKINTNEVRIAELKAAMNAPGTTPDYEYEKKINTLEAANQDLESRMVNYENDQGRDWDTFKREFNDDMNTLGQAFKSLVVKSED